MPRDHRLPILNPQDLSRQQRVRCPCGKIVLNYCLTVHLQSRPHLLLIEALIQAEAKNNPRLRA
jgi:hypothetical protein